MRRLCMLIALLAAAASANAADYPLMGVGSRTCGQFGSAYQKFPQVAENDFFSWAQGFMSGLNMALSTGERKNLAGKPIEEEQSILRQYCNDHPLDDFYRAVYNLYSDLPNSRGK